MENSTPAELNPQQNYLHHKLLIRGRIAIWGGLHIGGSNTAMDIGGLSAAVVRDPVTSEPYIPGSSLKGKLRSLLETWYGHLGTSAMNNVVQNGPCVHPDAPSAKLFGYIHEKKKASGSEKGNEAKAKGQGEKELEQRASRLIVRDAYLTNGKEVDAKTDLLFTQSKTEVVIDRVTAGAMPRTMERVPRHAVFQFEMVLNILEAEKELEAGFWEDLWCAMQLLQDDYLGGKGSRGSGHVDLMVESVIQRPRAWYKTQKGEVATYLDQCKLPESLKQFTYPILGFEDKIATP